MAAGSDFVRIERQALGLQAGLEDRPSRTARRSSTRRFATPPARIGRSRWSTPCRVAGATARAGSHDPRQPAMPVEPGREYVNATPVPRRPAADCRAIRWPPWPTASSGAALGIDMARPAFFRAGYNAGTGELFLAYDIGLTPEKPAARLRFCRFAFDPAWGFRAALARYYELFPDAFRCRTPQQGLWMPFAKISKVEGLGGFRLQVQGGQRRDGLGRRARHHHLPLHRADDLVDDDAQGDAADHRGRAGRGPAAGRQKGTARPRRCSTSGYHDAAGQIPGAAARHALVQRRGVEHELDARHRRRGDRLQEQVERRSSASSSTARSAQGDLDGEYIDSSEGYVTDELDFRRDHFAAADTPLDFSPDDAPAGHLPRPGRLRVRPRRSPTTCTRWTS